MGSRGRICGVPQEGDTRQEVGAQPMGLPCTRGSRVAEESGGATKSSALMVKGGRGWNLILPSLPRLTGEEIP